MQVPLLPLALLHACGPAGIPDIGDSGGATATEVHPSFQLSPVQACPAPAALAWDDVAEEWGLLPGPDPDADHHHGGALALGDFDGDGVIDLATGWPQVPARLQRGIAGGGFEAPVSLPGPAGIFLLGSADLDADGDPDLLAGGYRAPPAVWRNEGGSLSPMPFGALPVSGPGVRELAPIDLEGDGQLELYAMANTGNADPARRRDFLLRASDTGWSVEEGHASSTGRGFDVVSFDMDGDGDLDAYVANDDGADYGGDAFLRNDGGLLVDVTQEAGAALVHLGMGVDVADPNRDGLPDLYVTAVGHNALLEALPDGTWVDVARARGADPIDEAEHMGWGAIFLDADNDARTDVLVAQGDRWFAGSEVDSDGTGQTIVYDTPVNLLLQTAEGAYSEAAPSFGLTREGSWRSVIAEDLNGDGVLDLLASDTVARPSLWLSRGCTEAGWIEVEAPLGARVRIEAGGVTQWAWVTSASSYGAGRPASVHLGLGTAQRADVLEVTLPGEAPRLATNLPARRKVRVAR